MEVVVLNSGNSMPMIGLGTADPLHDVVLPGWVDGRFKFVSRVFYRFVFSKLWRVALGYKLSKSVMVALQSGYTMIDTSAAYRNERFIRRGIRWSGVQREKLFIITRVSNQQQWAGDIRSSLKKSLRALGTDYVDLYMFHWPVPDAFEQTWKEMELLYKDGLVKSIGVANCHKHHIEKILSFAKVTPSVNEFEIHPLMSQDALIDYCKSNNIVPIAYTPVGRFHEKLRNNSSLITIADQHNKTIPQVILRWHFQRGIPTIPRSVNEVNIRSNIEIFDFNLSENEMKDIDAINEDLRLRFDPDNCDFTKL